MGPSKKLIKLGRNSRTFFLLLFYSIVGLFIFTLPDTRSTIHHPFSVADVLFEILIRTTGVVIILYGIYRLWRAKKS